MVTNKTGTQRAHFLLSKNIELNCWFIVDSTQLHNTCRRYLDLPILMVGKFYKPPSIRKMAGPLDAYTGATQD